MNMHTRPPLPDQAILHYGDGEYTIFNAYSHRMEVPGSGPA